MRRERLLLERLSVETRLLLLSAGPPHTDGEFHDLLATRSVDWVRLLTMADRERATGVLWRRIKPHLPPTFPDEMRAPFERTAMVADFTASYLEQRIGETMAHLNERGVRGLLLKGGALAATVYGSFAERPMGDIDLLIEDGRTEEAFDAFREIGWRWDAVAFPRERYQAHHHFPPLLDSRGMDLRLEIHTELFVEGSPFDLSARRLFEAGREISIGAGRVVIPSAEHLLLHSCVHYTWSHMMLFGAWRAFRDVIALSGAGLNWELFLAEAKRYRAESACFWTLRLAERLAGASLPQEVLARLAESTSVRWISVCERHAAREMLANADRCPSQWLRRTLWETAIRPDEAGHGAARPWLLDDMAPENLAPERREFGMVRAARQLPRLGAWIRYVAALAR